MTRATCEVCDQPVRLVLGEWQHERSGTWANLPVRHRAQVLAGSAAEAKS